jgi:SAM-dependent methyltransferase
VVESRLVALTTIQRLLRTICWSTVFDLDTFTIRRAVRRFSSTVEPQRRLLDVGAGQNPYASYFAHCRYESCDFGGAEEFHGAPVPEHTFRCSLDAIPVLDGAYDAVLCTEVLEHVKSPQAALSEIYRVLRPGGSALITVPQGYGLHGEPFHYSNFTRYGLDLLLRGAGFREVRIKERGGYFWHLYDRIALAVPRMGRQNVLTGVLLLPLHIVLAYVLGPICLALDPVDRDRKWTLGYAAYVVK